MSDIAEETVWIKKLRTKLPFQKGEFCYTGGMDWGSQVTYIGSTTLREKTVRFGIKDVDRTKHLSILGRTGAGRGDMLVSMALQDIERGIGTVFLDATGTSSRALLERIDPKNQDRLIFLDPSDAEYPYSWNILDDVRVLPRDEQLSALAGLISHVYNVSETNCVESAAALLLDHAGSTLADFHSLATDEAFRETFFKDRKEERKTFETELSCVPDLVAALEGEGKYIAKDTLIRNLIGQKDSKFTLGEVANGKIVVVDFSHIRMYPTRMSPLVRSFVDAARFLGGTSQAPIALYLHDTVRYLLESEIDSAFTPGANLALTIADTMQQQADQERRLYALSRIASVASFAAHAADRELIEQVFYPFVEADEITKLDPREFIITLTIDGVRKKPFFATALESAPKKNIAYQDLVVDARQKYTTTRSKVDASLKVSKGDDSGKKDKPPGGNSPKGFQDAFRSIFAKQAERTKQQQEAHTGSASPAAVAPGAPPPAPPISVPQQKREIPEQALKQMLYVRPVS